MTAQKSAILFADRKGAELAPLNDHYSPATLPIGGKSALEFWFEYLCEQKVEEVYLFVATHSAEIKNSFPSGEHWGFKLTYLLSRGEEAPADLINRNRETLPEQFLAARGDIVPQPSGVNALLNIENIDLSDPSAETKLNTLSWQSISRETQTPHLMHSLQAFSAITQQVLQSKLWCCTPRGLMLDDHKWTATPDFSNQRMDSIEGTLYVGRDSVIDRSVALKEMVVVETASFVDRGATLKNAIVLPDTYVGQNVSLEGCLVYGSLMIDLKNGVTQQIDDPALLSPITSSARVTRTRNSERFAAAFMMLLSAWFVLPLALLLKRRGSAWVSRTLSRSNRGSRQYPIGFECLSFNTGWTSLNTWPRFIHVIDGDLKLFGTQLEGLDQEPILADLPISQGVFTPQQLHPKHQFDEVEAQLWGLEMANASNGFCRLTLKSLRAIANATFRGGAPAQ